MRYNKILFFAAMLVSVGLAYAQTQSGVVKTRGRMVGGKLVPGTLLQGVTVQVGGRQAVMATDGHFSFAVQGGKYELQKVQKQGYRLVDAEACRWYRYSATPLTIVMEKPEQQMQDKLSAERKIRRQLQDQLHQREDEIEALREQNRLTEEQYRQALQELYSNQESNEKLIADMARRYSELDYDQLDEFQRQVTYCIENGQLSKADSLLRSRGNMAQQVEASLKAAAALQQQRDQLNKAEAVQAAQTDEMAQRCYSYYQLFAARFQNDSAAHYLELRSRLDTGNAQWLGETAYYIERYLADYNKALRYYRQMLRRTMAEHGEKHPLVASAYTGMARELLQIGKTDSAMMLFDKALKIRQKCFGKNHPMVANALKNIGQCHASYGNYDKAASCFAQAKKIYQKTVGDTNADLADCYNAIGFCAINRGPKYAAEAKENLQKALQIYTNMHGTRKSDVSLVYMNLAIMHADLYSDYKTAMDYYNKCMEIEKLKVGENHPRVARLYDNMASIAIIMEDYAKAIGYSQKSLDINSRFFGNDHIDLALANYNMGLAYYYTEQWEKALPYLQKNEKIITETYGSDVCQLHEVLFIIGDVYNSLDSNSQALNYFRKTLDIQQRCLGKNDPETAVTHYRIADECIEFDDIQTALKHYTQALKLFEKSGTDDENVARIRTVIDEINAYIKNNATDNETINQ